MKLLIKITGFLFAMLFCYSIPVLAQKTKTVQLKATESISLQSFHIQNVIDDRGDKGSIGTIHTGLGNKVASIDLEHGATNAISDFIRQNVTTSDIDNAVELHIVTLKVTETREKGMQERADLDAKFAFYINGEKLIEYSGNSYTEASLDASPYIGKMVSESVQHVLKEFDGWFKDNESKYKDTKKFIVNVVLKTVSDNANYIVYTKSTHLQFDDFIGKPDQLSGGDAGTYSGMEISYEVNNKTGPTIATIEVMPYMDKTQSWMKPRHKSAYILAHEQLHFDITAYFTCQFVDVLKHADLNTSNLKQVITSLQQKYVQLIQDTQEQYDDVTQHGLLADKQKEWEEKIKSELAATDCY